MDTKEVLAWLERKGTRRTVEGMARYGLPSDRAFGVPVGTMRALAKRIGKDHALATALWESGWYEARMMAAFVDDPRLVTRRQMNAWAADFDNWGICDTACFHLFDRTPFAWEKALALLPLLEKGAHDERNFVKKGVNWALRTIGKRSLALNAAALAASKRRARSEAAAPRWVGKDALRELASPQVQARLQHRIR